MKKLYFLLATMLVAVSANAEYTLNNPVGEDGRYIVKWDCQKGAFADANDFESDEAFTLAVDLTGTWLEEWLKGTPSVEGASRGVALNHWTNYGDVNGDIRRLKQISGNIYGATWILKSHYTNDSVKALVSMVDSVIYVHGQLFGFEFTDDNPGAAWWQWDNNAVEETMADGSDCLFATLPYTGEKTSTEFYGDDEGFPDMFGFGLAGYGAPCLPEETSALENVNLTFDVVGVEYYNILGQKISELPQNGIYVKTMTLSNGKRVSEKILVK